MVVRKLRFCGNNLNRKIDFEEKLDKFNDLVYDNDSQKNRLSYGGEFMNSKDAFLAVLRKKHVSQREIARRMGWTAQQLAGRLSRDSLRADEFFELLDSIGVKIQFVERDTGEIISMHKMGAGRRVKAMVDRVIYDTHDSDALSNNFFADGVNEYTDGKALELYIDREGRYFFAEYSSWEGVKDRITPVSASDAAAFIEKYGTEINKKPTSTNE